MSEQLIPTPSVFGETGNFLLERELGRGGMGGVYMGRDKMLDRPVAVKVMLQEYGSDAEFVERFKHEAQAAARLIHPNIAQIYSYGIADGMPYIAMELVAGGSLDQLMRNAPGKTDVPRIMKIGEQVAQALRCAADQGLVHGDIKPENILLDANGNAKIVDFGLAGMQKNTDEIWGTPYYISPEKVRKEVVDYRADMYSLGATLYHALTGVAPFEGEDATSVVKKRFEGMPKKPSEVRPGLSPQIDALIMTMLAFNKEERFPSFEALIEEFKKVMTTGLTTTQAVSTASVATPAKTGTMVRSTGKRMVVHGKRTMTMKRPVSAPVPPVEDEEDDEDEKGGGLGAKVAGVIIGVIVVVGGLVGGLVWYKSHERSSADAAYQSTIETNCKNAREAVATTRKAAAEFADKFAAFAQKATDGCVKASDELSRLLPEFAADLKLPPPKELLDLIASTNAAVLAAEAPAATNGVAAASTGATNAASAAATAPAPAATEAPAEESRKLPAVVKDMQAIWERAYSCQASVIRIHIAMMKVVAECDKANGIVGQTKEAMEALGKLSQDAKDMYEQARGSKDVENVEKGISYINSRGERAIKKTMNELRLEKIRRDREDAAARAAAIEAARKKKLEEERRQKIESETTAVREKFDAIAATKTFRLLDWAHAIRQLKDLKSEFTTAEGSLAADDEIRKVEAMKTVQDILMQNMVGYKFRVKSKEKPLRGCVVKSANKKEITMVGADGTTSRKMTWQKFYEKYPGNLNELLNKCIVDGKGVSKLGNGSLSAKARTEAMFGAALTMRLICSDVPGAQERSEQIVREAVKGFEDEAMTKTAQRLFPDIENLGQSASTEE